MEQRKLYIEPCAGLGNRLSALASAFYWAEKEKYQVNIVWKKENPCSVKYDSIFEKKETIPVKEVNQMFTNRIQEWFHVYSNVWLALKKRKCLFVSNENLKKTLINEGFDGVEQLFKQGKDLYIKSTGFFMPEEYIPKYAQKYIFFSEELCQRVKEPFNKDAYYVGIHIRRTDHQEAINNSSTQSFELAIKDEIAANSSTKFYIATDDLDERNNLEAKYKGCILPVNHYANSISRVTDDGMKDAVLDMLSLAMCQKVYGSSGSTFSVWSNILGNNELIVVK